MITFPLLLIKEIIEFVVVLYGWQLKVNFMADMQHFSILKSKVLTIKGEVAKDGSEQIHDKHPQDGHVGNGLHASLCGTKGVKTTIIKEIYF